MNIELHVDAITYNIARVFTMLLFAAIAGFAASMAAEHYKIQTRLHRPLIIISSLAAGIGSFLVGWASLNLSLLSGLMFALGGAALMLAEGTWPRSIFRRAGGVVVLAMGVAWIGWNVRLMFH